MKRLFSLLFILGLLAIASLMSACGASADSATQTAAPTITPIPSTATPLPTESQEPTELSEVPRITAEELKERIDNGEAIVVVDTRGKPSYDTRHIAGAILAPKNYDEYPLDQEIVLYCT